MRPNPGDLLSDKYRLDRVLGEGGMSMVFAAVNTLTGKQVAIKWLQPEVVGDDEQSQRLLREAQATSAIDHPNVVNVFDVGQHDGALFLVMELLYGEPLSQLLFQGEQEPCEFVQLMMPVLRGVQAAHRMGVVHRDLKPDNIFLCRDPHGEAREPKVLDFGISKLADDLVGPGKELTREGTVFGTPQYMAPEQMRDARVADARSDIYALGVIFYRALCGQYPYDGDSLTALAIRIVEGHAEPVHVLRPEVHPELSAVIMRALSLEPDDRFPSVAAFAQALEPHAGGVLFSTRDSSPGRESLLPARASHVAGRSSLMTPRASLVTPRASLVTPRASHGLSGSSPAALSPAGLDDDALFDDGPTIVGTRFTMPPPLPPPAAAPVRPVRSPSTRERFLPTLRLETRAAPRQSLFWTGVALFGVAMVAPAGWQLWHKARGESDATAARAPAPASVGDTATRSTAPVTPLTRASLVPVTESLAPPSLRPELREPIRSTDLAPRGKRRMLPAPAPGTIARAQQASQALSTADAAESSGAAPGAPRPERNPYIRR